MNNYELNESRRKCRKLISMIEQDTYIPSALFSGETAETLKQWKIMQKARIERIQMKLNTLK